MQFFHLSDLHIGKQLHHYNLIPDQEHILAEIVSYAEQLQPDAIVIAGDIYDKSVPSAEAVSVFDTFLTALTSLTPKIPVMLISGNHDSSKRLDYASSILLNQEIYIAGEGPRTEEEHLLKVTLEDENGPVHFYLLPFVKPGYIRHLYPEVSNYEEAVRFLVEREDIDMKVRNVLVSHQFYTASSARPETCDSEIFSVGGVDNVDVRAVKEFDYVALGHIHGPQRMGKESIRYCGTPLKYSVSECGHKKSLTVVTLGKKGTEPKIETYPLHPLRDVRKLNGTLEEVLAQANEKNQEDYVSVTLTDEAEPYQPREQLLQAYPHVLEIRMDNTRTRQRLTFVEEELRLASPLDTFSEFYHAVQGRELSEEAMEMLHHVMESVKEEM